MRPHISVCIPVYQGAPTLAATLRSVLASENADFEVVIRDNGSTDGTSCVVAGFDDPRIRYIRSEGTLPLPANWRATVGQARGELIKVLCADDLISPDCLASQAALLKDPTVALVACRRNFIDGNGDVLNRNAGLPGLLGRHGVSEVARKAVRFGINPVGEPACVMFRRRDYDAIGGFDGAIVFAMDIDAWLRILTRGDMIGQPEAHASFRMWTESFSNSHNRQQLGEHLRFFKQVANNPRYEIPTVLRHLSPATARVSWRAWAVRQWLWGRRGARGQAVWRRRKPRKNGTKQQQENANRPILQTGSCGAKIDATQPTTATTINATTGQATRTEA